MTVYPTVAVCPGPTCPGKNISLMMVKNSLLRRVFTDFGIKPADEAWAGTTVVAWGGESVKDLSKEIDAVFLKDAKLRDKVKVKTALAEGQPVTFAGGSSARLTLRWLMRPPGHHERRLVSHLAESPQCQHCPSQPPCGPRPAGTAWQHATGDTPQAAASPSSTASSIGL